MNLNLNDREKTIAIAAGVGLAGLAIVNGAYRSGFNAGLSQSGNPRAHYGDGFDFFPPFPLILIGVIGFFWWRRRQAHNGHGGGHGGGPGSGGRGPGGKPGGGPPRFFDDWHRRAHESQWEAPRPASPTAPADPAQAAQPADPSRDSAPPPATETANPGPPTYV